MIHYWKPSALIRDGIYIPKYYNPKLLEQEARYRDTHHCQSISSLVEKKIISATTGHEIGKAAYGTGDIPFVRTSDISNWEIKSIPKQGVSQEIYKEYAADQNIEIGDIFFVRDGTYLIGNSCFITSIDKEVLFQSHILKLRVHDKKELDPYLLFLALNCPWVQQQIRSVQFTADIIDTIGQRFFELILPFPKNHNRQQQLSHECKKALSARMIGKAFIKHCPKMIEEALRTGSTAPIEEFNSLSPEEIVEAISNETVSAEFGEFTSFWKNSNTLENQIYLPTYYDINITKELNLLEKHCKLVSIRELMQSNEIEFHTGDEIGKMAYNTGTIPFLRTSDFSNWEINHNPKQGVSEEIFEQYSKKQDVQENDVLLVRDGTYLVGSTCIITKSDKQSLFCGGMFKFRIRDNILNPFLFLGLMNSYIVKRQMRTKQFTRDVIDTLGNRIEEVVLPIPKSKKVRDAISESVQMIVESRIQARETISALSEEITA